MQPGATLYGTVLIGPTGSGKTPLGRLIAQHGLPDGLYWHFDFGEQLRLIASGQGAAPVLSAEERAIVREVLNSGRLLRPNEKTIGLTVLKWFLDQHDAGSGSRSSIVLNGFPRTVDQAECVAELISLKRVIWLNCPWEVVWKRIQQNTGGDRMGREDDSHEAVLARYRNYLSETLPLIEFYRSRAVPVIQIDVTESAGPEELFSSLTRSLQGQGAACGGGGT